MSWHRFHGLLRFFQTCFCKGDTNNLPLNIHCELTHLFSWCISLNRKFSPRRQVALSNLSLSLFISWQKNGRFSSTRRPPRLCVACGSVAGGGPVDRGADRCVDGPLPGGLRVGRLGAGVQPAPAVHGAGDGLPARRRWVGTDRFQCPLLHIQDIFDVPCWIRLIDGIVGALQTLKLVTQPACVPLFTALGVYHKCFSGTSHVLWVELNSEFLRYIIM